MIENFNQQTNSKSPPHQYIKQLANKAHASISTFYKLWENMDDKNKLYIEQSDLAHKLNIHSQKFQRDVIDICNEGLCNWTKTKKRRKQYIEIELIGWNESLDA
jgi:hypothetical protein